MTPVAMSRLRRLYLVVTMTKGMSLAAWEKGGHLSREIEIYRRLTPHLGGITIVSHGNASDQSYAQRLPGIDILVPSRAAGWRAADLAEQILQSAKGRQIIVKTNQLPGGDLAAEAAAMLGAPFVARNGYLHAEFIERMRGKDHPDARDARNLERRIFVAATRIVVTTPAMRRTAMERYGLPDEKIVVVPNYVDADLFAPGDPANAVPGRIGFVGRLAPQKNLDALFDGLRGFQGELVLVGAGELEDHLRQRAETERLPVEFRPPMQNHELPAFLHGCSGFVLPSLFEGHPKVLIEAMSTGLPCVVTAVPGIAEMVEDEVNALLCEPNGASIRHALDRLVADPVLAGRLGGAARASVLSRFSLDLVVKNELHTLATVAAPEAGGHPSPNGDLPMGQDERHRYLRHARRQLRAEAGSQARPPLHMLQRSDALRSERGDSPLRIYSDAILAEAITPFAGRSVAVLDVGCGRGHYAAFLGQRGIVGEYLGVDIATSDDWQRFAGTQGGLNTTFRQGMIESLDLPNAHFDFIFSSSALEHIADDTAAVAKLHAATRPGGLGLHLVPAPGSIVLYGYHGWRRYDPDTLCRLFEAAGFEVSGMARLGGLPSLALHAVWIGTLEAGITRLILHDWLRKGGPDDHWRGRAGRPWLPRLRQGPKALRAYATAFGMARRVDPLLPRPTSGYAIWTRRPA